MSRVSFENFGKVADQAVNDTVTAARDLSHQSFEKKILADVVKKLDIQPTDSLLDIGCNTGNLTIPLSFMVREVVGIDHVSCTKRLMERVPLQENIRTYGCNFLDYSGKEQYDKILIYSVLHYLENKDEVMQFVSKALTMLKPGGRILLGDIPNKDKIRRHEKTGAHQRYVEEYRRELENSRQTCLQISIVDYLGDSKKDRNYVQFNDKLVLEIVEYSRQQQFDSYIVQQENLIFSLEREDIVVEHPGP